MCRWEGCSKRRIRKKPPYISRRPYSLTPANALKYCRWHLDPDNRETPEQRRARILAEANGDTPYSARARLR